LGASLGRLSRPIRLGPIRIALLAGLLLALWAPSALGQPYLPPAGRIYAGVTAGHPRLYEKQTGAHAAVFQEFVDWGTRIGWAASLAKDNGSTLMLALQLAGPGMHPPLSPAQIAAGRGDGWLKWLGNYLFWRAQPTYLRLMGEMDDYWSPSCAFNANGSSRGAAYSPGAFRQAWKRIVLILRGGPVSQINRTLHSLKMPPVTSTYATLPVAPVAFLWVPSTYGDPAVRGNQPADYYPGKAWVDWVGTDYYSKFPNWAPLTRFYNAFRGRPFAFGEWAVWGADSASFVNQMFKWVLSHPRVRLLMYNQGYKPNGPLSLSRYPAAAAAIRRELRRPVFSRFTPGWMRDG
jgi:hypothetical protein